MSSWLNYADFNKALSNGLAEGGYTGAAIPVVMGGNGVTTVTTAPTASAWAGWDANENLTANNFLQGFTSTVTSATSITLTAASSKYQYLTGTIAQVIDLPLPSTLSNGHQIIIDNNSTATATINTSLIVLVDQDPQIVNVLTCIDNTLTTAAAWDFTFSLRAAFVPVAYGGTGQNALITIPTANTIPAWDANKNISCNYCIQGYQTSAVSITLTVASPFIIYMTGTTNTITLPVVSTLVLGRQFQIHNAGTGACTVNSSGANLVKSLATVTGATFTCILITGTTAASWTSV